MPVEISIPFRLGPDKRIATESNPDAQIRQHVMSLVNTEPGERVVLGDYGVPLSDLVFEDGDVVVANALAIDIANALGTFEPGVAIQEIVPGPTRSTGDGLDTVNVKYLRTDAPTSSTSVSRSQNVAVISTGGHVSEVIRG